MSIEKSLYNITVLLAFIFLLNHKYSEAIAGDVVGG